MTSARVLCFVLMVGMATIAMRGGLRAEPQSGPQPESPASVPVPAAPRPGPPQSTPPTPPAAPPQTPPVGITPPADYVIGSEDVLTIFYWNEKNMSAEVVVRPDGKITLPLLNDIQATGLTPDELRQRIVEAASRYVETPAVTVSVKAINSRKAFITGMVNKPGAYSLTGPTTVLQLIALAGGLQEYADAENIVVVRASEKRPHGEPMSYRVNYKEIMRRNNLRQNIELKVGDTVVVP
jgi:polysaccharide export outer membrane protein